MKKTELEILIQNRNQLSKKDFNYKRKICLVFVNVFTKKKSVVISCAKANLFRIKSLYISIGAN